MKLEASRILSELPASNQAIPLPRNETSNSFFRKWLIKSEISNSDLEDFFNFLEILITSFENA